MIRLNQTQIDAINQIAEQSYPDECCGLVLGRTEGDDVEAVGLYPAENQRSDSPRNRYQISPEFFYQVEKEFRGTGLSVVGFFHSHPDVAARPSAYDQEHAWPGYSYIIVSVLDGRADELLSWQLREDRGAFEPEEVEIAE